MMHLNKLLYTPIPKPYAPFRLICFPYAGGNISTYRSWSENIHNELELTLIQLPGRAFRLTEPAYENMEHLVGDVILALQYLPPKKNIFFGHSMGAKIAYDLALKLFTLQQELPTHIFISGCSAPTLDQEKELIHLLPDDKFIEKLGDFDGTPKALLENAELMSLVLPALRADFKISENYKKNIKIKIPTTVSVFCGKEDKLIQKGTEAWSNLFSACTGVHWFDGNHFFIEQNNKLVLKQVNLIFEQSVR